MSNAPQNNLAGLSASAKGGSKASNGTTMTDLDKHQRMANAIRFLAIDAVEKANSGHPGMPMGTSLGTQ